jgi:hypothetical protein
MADDELERALARIEPRGREVLRRLMRAGQQERDQFAMALLRHSESEVARDLADVLDAASMSPDARRQLARVLGRLEALSGESD